MDTCPVCGGTMELYTDGFEYCDTCGYNTRDNSIGEDDV